MSRDGACLLGWKSTVGTVALLCSSTLAKEESHILSNMPFILLRSFVY